MSCIDIKIRNLEFVFIVSIVEFTRGYDVGKENIMAWLLTRLRQVALTLV